MDPTQTLIGPRYCRLETYPSGLTELTVFCGDSSTHETNPVFYKAAFQDLETANRHADSWIQHGRPYEEERMF